MKTTIDKQLDAERHKLNKMVDEALAKGAKMLQSEEIMAQCEKIDRLLIQRNAKGRP